MRIVRGSPQLSIDIGQEGEEQGEHMTAPITFEWRASDGQVHQATPKISQKVLELPSSDEDLPDFFLRRQSDSITH